MANPGDGFGSKSTCENYCAGHGPHPGPGPHDDTYRCNTTVGICEKCTNATDTGCGPDRATQCNNCKPPPPDMKHKFKCNKTDEANPKCEKCPDDKQEGCDT